MAALGTAARYALGGIRFLNGAIALAAPGLIIQRLGDTDPHSNAAATYALRAAPIIHASDTGTVLALRASKQLSPELARPLALISGTNTVLALTAFLASRRSRR